MFGSVILIIVLVAAIIVLYWTILKSSSAKIHHQYSLLAGSYGLELNAPEPVMAGFVRPEPSLYGQHKDRELSISAPGKGLQNTRQIETVLKLELKARHVFAEFSPGGIFAGFRKADKHSLVPWSSGDAEFDSAIKAQTNSADLLNRALTPELRQSMVRLLKSAKGSLYLGNGVLAYAELGLISSEATRERFEQMIAFMNDLAESIETAKP